jgi:hypothetical protein
MNSVLSAEKQLLSFGDALYQQVVALHVRVNIVYWNVDQHTGDLGRLVAGKTLHKGVNDVAHVLLVVGVLLYYHVQDWHGLSEVICVDAALGSHKHRHVSTHSNWHRQAGSDWHCHVHSHVVGHVGLTHLGLGAMLLVLLLAPGGYLKLEVTVYRFPTSPQFSNYSDYNFVVFELNCLLIPHTSIANFPDDFMVLILETETTNVMPEVDYNRSDPGV